MHIMQNPTFLIIDSGVGGLSIWHEIQQRIPHAHACYVADNGAYPYGALAEQVLVERLLSLLPELEQRYQPDIIVIACNTASTVVLDHLRAQISTPIIGVVPAIKPAAELSVSRQVTLLATPGTIKRQYTDRLIQEFGKGCAFTRIGSHELVHEAERKLRGLPVNMDTIRQELAPLIQPNNNTDVLILGCTHFPFLKDEISQLIPAGIRVIDSGNAIARRAQQLLDNLAATTGHETHLTTNTFLFTAESGEAHNLEPGILHFGFDKIQFLTKSTTQNEQKSGAS
ncbi:glutamate racemase [Ketobacter alkanivorans]|uniref:Glutamate racemase n=2 Tax=Ketobacter alkanivorans TaxID=1917421 RepID=A0A2K9LTZ8_9GAMM|nr:glutamate racemase [Ketobacter alkanivorans]